MVHPKLRRVAAFSILLSVLTLLPAQAAGIASRAPRGESLSERFERWQLTTWDFLVGLLEKAGMAINPDGARSPSRSTAPDGGR